MRSRDRGDMWVIPVLTGYVCTGKGWRRIPASHHVVVTYQWLQKTKGRWRVIAGATGSVYTVTGPEPVKCRVEVWDPDGRVIMNTRKISPKR